MKQERSKENTSTSTPTADTAFNGELLTLKEAAQILKITRKPLYQWKAKGKIRTVKIAGSLVRVPRADLDNLITAALSQ